LYHHLDAPVAHDAFSVDSSKGHFIVEDLAPTVLFIPQCIQKQVHDQPLVALLDPGSNITFLHRRTLPTGAVPTLLPGATTGTTLAGEFTSKTKVWMDNIILPEFTRSRRVTSQRALIFENACPYDVILGRDFFVTLESTSSFLTVLFYGKVLRSQ
jgi:hypothetical protein